MYVNHSDKKDSSSPVGSGGVSMPDVRKIKPKRNSPYIGVVVSIVIALGLLTAWYFVSDYQPKGEEVALSNVVRDIVDEKYEKIVLKDDYVVLVEDSDNRVHALIDSKTGFYSLMDGSGVSAVSLQNDFYEPNVGLTLEAILTFAFLTAGLILLYMMIKNMQASGGKIMDFGQSKAKLLFGKKTGVMFKDVAGIDDVKEELIEVVDFLKNPKKYTDLGARIPRGVLLVGAPGTGKTLLAKAVAGEAGVPFFHTSGAEFEEMLVGAGAARVRDLFKKARKASPCIIFIDEIDAVAKKRGAVMNAGSGEQTLHQILVEMDGLEDRANVIVLAATNRPDVLDPAILRPGRFDRNVVVHMPSKKGRKEILAVHSKGKKFGEDVDMDVIAKKTVGYSGADLENLLNEAAIMAVIDNRKVIAQRDLLESYLKVRIGRKKNGENTDDDIKRIAYHEAGHAVVAKMTEGSHPVEKISIISRGGSGGVTVYLPEDESSLQTKTDLRASVVSSVGGKIAEEVFLGEMTTGASSDIKQATEVAKAMVTTYGMSEKLGFVKYGGDSGYLGYQASGQDYSDETAKMIDEEVRKIIDDAQVHARKVLEDSREIVEKLVEILLDKEEVDRDEFEALFAGGK